MVKAILKRNNILLSQFANDLNISRPTLDSYIKAYDIGEALSNNLYQKIFDFLFGNSFISNDEFSKKYLYVVNNYGNSTDLKTLSSASANSSLISLVNTGSLLNYLGDYQEKALGEMIVSKDELLYGLIRYRALLDHKADSNALSDREKMICEKFFAIEKKLSEQDYTYDATMYSSFESKANETVEDMKKEELKRRISTKISDMVNNAIDNDDISSLNEILQKLNMN